VLVAVLDRHLLLPLCSCCSAVGSAEKTAERRGEKSKLLTSLVGN
jgi:hypothetical protein